MFDRKHRRKPRREDEVIDLDQEMDEDYYEDDEELYEEGDQEFEEEYGDYEDEEYERFEDEEPVAEEKPVRYEGYEVDEPEETEAEPERFEEEDPEDGYGRYGDEEPPIEEEPESDADYEQEDDLYEDEEALDSEEPADEYDEDYDKEFEEDYGDYSDEDGYDYDDEEVAAAGTRHDRGRGGFPGRGRASRRRRGGISPVLVAGGKVLEFIKNTDLAERAAAIVAILLVAGAITTMVFYSKAKDYREEIGSFAEVGAGLELDDAVGAYGLLAIADAEKARAYAAEIVEEEEEEVSDVAQGVTVQMTLTSIKSDMKIKFINSESGKLVANVHFEVDVVTPDGAKVTYDDHDKDGIIYKNNLTAGTYKVTPKTLSSEFSEYKLETESKSLKIKDTVEMKAVDVSNEIKKESQVNAAVEDTAVADVVESALQDTVEYVESSKTPVDGEGGDGEYSYESIDKSSIVDPSTSSSLAPGSVKRMALSRSKTSEEGSEDASTEESEDNDDSEDDSSEDSSESEEKKTMKVTPSSMSLKIGEGESFIVSGPDDYSVSSSDDSVASLDGQTVNAVGAGKATIKITADGYEDASISVTVEGGKEEEPDTEKKDITLSTDSLTLEVGETGKITASGADGIKFKSDDESVAKVNSEGVITARAAGSCTITAYADGCNDAKCSITVKAKGDSSELSMNVSKITLVQGQTFKLEPKDSSLSVSYKSENSDVAKVSDGTVTGVKAGETTITASCSGFKDATIKVKVVKSSTVLKDKDGRTVYVKDSDGNYVEATYDDYYKGSKFYIRKTATNYKYTGWQTIDGKTYYYDKNGNYVTGEQVIQGAKYTFGSDGALSSSSGTMGIDVSKWNGNINWSQVKNSGVNFVIIRCGYRGSSAGALIEDPKFRANIQGAQAAGLRVGVYFFTQAVNEVEAVEEASMCINLCKGYSLSFPIFLDVEASNGRGDAISTSQRTANIKAFCGTIQSAGYRAGVYANKTWFSQRINTSQLTNYKIWLAQYAASVSYTATRYDMWQYTSKGSVPGISGNVDMNILYN